MQANRNIHLWEKKSTHLQVISQQNTQTQQTWGYRHTTKNQRAFLSRDTGVNFSFRNIVANLGSFAKVSSLQDL